MPMTSEFLLGRRSKLLPNPRNQHYSADVHPKDTKGGEHKRKWAGALAQQVKGEAKRQKWVRMSSPHWKGKLFLAVECKQNREGYGNSSVEATNSR